MTKAGDTVELNDNGQNTDQEGKYCAVNLL